MAAAVSFLATIAVKMLSFMTVEPRYSNPPVTVPETNGWRLVQFVVSAKAHARSIAHAPGLASGKSGCDGDLRRLALGRVRSHPHRELCWLAPGLQFHVPEPQL